MDTAVTITVITAAVAFIVWRTWRKHAVANCCGGRCGCSVKKLKMRAASKNT